VRGRRRAHGRQGCCCMCWRLWRCDFLLPLWPGHDSLFHVGAPLWLSSCAFKSRHAAERRSAGGRRRSGSSRASRCARDASEVHRFLIPVDLVSSISSWTRGRAHTYRGPNIKNTRGTIIYIRSRVIFFSYSKNHEKKGGSCYSVWTLLIARVT
jgi:hypothetical protein